MILPVVRLISQSYYDNSFDYIEVEDITKVIARKHTYYNAADKTLEIELNQDLINSIIKDNLDSLGVEIPGGTIRDLKFNTEEQRLYVNIKYGMLKLPLSFAINVDFSETGIKIWGSDVHLGKRNAPRLVKKQVPLDMLTFEVNFEEIGVPDVFTLEEVKFRPGYVAITAQLLPEKIAELAIREKEGIVNNIQDFKNNQPSFLQAFIDKIMETDLLADEKIQEYVDGILSNGELVNSAIHFAMADDFDKYSKALEDCGNAISEWASPLTAIRLDGSVDETIESILYNEDLKEFATWFVPEETVQEYASTAESFYETWKESQALALEGEFDSSIENLLYSESVTDMLSWFVPRDTAEKCLSDAKEYYALYSTTKDMVENGEYEQAFEHVIYNESTEKLISQLIDDETASELLAVADEGYNIYKTSSQLLADGQYEEAAEYLIYDDYVLGFLSRFVPSDYLDEYTAITNEAYTIYETSGRLLSEGYYEDAIEYFIYDDTVSGFLSRFVPSDYLDEYFAFADEAYTIYTTSGQLLSEGNYEQAVEYFIYDDTVSNFLSRFFSSEYVDEYTSAADEAYTIYTTSIQLLSDGYYEDTIEYFIYDDTVSSFLSRLFSSEYVDEYTSAADEAYTIYTTSIQLLSDGYYEDTIEYFIYDDTVSSFLSRFVPSDYLNEYTAAADELFELYKTTAPMFEDGDYLAAAEYIAYSDTTASFINRVLPQEVLDEFNSYLTEIDNTMESIDMDVINEYADWIREYCFIQAESIRELTAEEIAKINTEDLEEVFAYIENDKGKAGEYVKSIDPVYYSNFKEYLKDATWLRDTVKDYIDSLDFSTAADYAYIVNEVTNFLSLLHDKDYLGAFELLTSSRVSDLLMDIVKYYS